jgi:hypothetical protein
MAPTLEQELEALHELEFESELEGEGEFELEMEGELEMEISPVRKIYADAMMEHLAHMASESETEQEAAEHFLPLIGMAAKKLLPMVARAVAPSVQRAIPKIASAVTRVEPRLTRGITTIVRGLHRQPATRRLLHAVPAIARRTVGSIARQAAHGRPITARGAIRTLATQARRVLSHPHRRRLALRRSAALDRRFHRQVGPGAVRPHGRGWRPGYGPGSAAPPARPGYPGGPGYRPAPVAGRCPACPPCPHGQPRYCGCCGQIVR